jgi:hypothetical protein
MEDKVSEIEFLLERQKAEKSDFKYLYDLNREETKLLKNRLLVLREKIAKAIMCLGIHDKSLNLSASWSIRTSLDYLLLLLEDATPERLKSYGEMSKDTVNEINIILMEISSFIQETINQLKKIKNIER